MGALSCSANLGSSLILDYSTYPTPVNSLIDNDDEPTNQPQSSQMRGWTVCQKKQSQKRIGLCGWFVIFGTFSFVALGIMRLVPGRNWSTCAEPFPKADFDGTVKELLEKIPDNRVVSAGEVPSEIVNEAASELSDIKYSSLFSAFLFFLSSATSLSQSPSIHSKKSKAK
ncbi:hypothetical protein PENFLA_c003G07255 [Penicillium flavigenum]|uniref:Uncharacterized protein n=1 Tax=Penicillium flavigenum TaxID=254877 RepID=A0A1V6TXR1_9EURO|nr:hypothetical protein PENFLA_c003G07255 [Penicillium flavigenum]